MEKGILIGSARRKIYKNQTPTQVELSALYKRSSRFTRAHYENIEGVVYRLYKDSGEIKYESMCINELLVRVNSVVKKFKRIPRSVHKSNDFQYQEIVNGLPIKVHRFPEPLEEIKSGGKIRINSLTYKIV